ncbi:hypothetical protein NQ314_008648 [Rhamnusium bicolor]|uniref:Uncharacterized protein n=1 Tax=Rhamnusium bicolor TaxID=1586634 RepID=A0AAV8Y8H4_9CUCU|nr:hypothetical protein NQ314_008648 [Rhamnusium bicolor]
MYELTMYRKHIGPLQIIFSCDYAIREAQKIIAIYYKYQDSFSIHSEEKQQLIHLLNQAINNKPAFTAAGFF